MLVSRAAKAGAVLVDGVPAKASAKLRVGQTIVFRDAVSQSYILVCVVWGRREQHDVLSFFVNATHTKRFSRKVSRC